MKQLSILLVVLFGSALIGTAALLSPEKLLPADTLGVIIVPDFAKAKSRWAESPTALLWRDLEMKTFREKFLEKWKTDFLTPLERELGIKFADYTSLAKGQLTFALTQNGWEGKTNQSPAWLVLVDTKDKREQLKQTLSDLRKKWVDSGRPIKTEKVRGIEFTTLIVQTDDISKTLRNVFPRKEKEEDAEKQNSTNKIELTFGQAESLLLVGTAVKDLEKVLIRQSGGLVPSLSEQPAFESRYTTMFRDSLAYGWIHFQPIAEFLSRESSENRPPNPRREPFRLDKALDALGLRSLTTVAFNLIDAPEGMTLNASLALPEGSRKGLFKVLAVDRKEAGPPEFVPSDTVKFSRWRLDGQKTWTALESMLAELSPQMGGFIKLVMETAGKEKDPNFDLRKSLIGNLGDDFISYQKIPRGAKPAELDSPPSIFLIGSAEADRLASAIKMSSALLPSESGGVKEREFLGRKIYSLPLPPMLGPEGGNPVERSLSFSASGGYLAFSPDVSLLEEYLRSSEAKGKSLAGTAGLKEAAQKVGGTGTGLFAYGNNSETMRVWLESVKQNPSNFEKGIGPLAGLFGIGASDPGRKDWFDFSLLPPFEKIAKFFYFTVYSGGVTPEGFNFKVFSPTPPQLRK